MNTQISNYRRDIQGLRAVAVISVIINHLNKKLLPGGYLGVDIFFIISGYVITSSLLNRPSSPYLRFLIDFYYRRMKRLLPALLTCTVATFFIGYLFINTSSPYYNSAFKTGMASLYGLSNIYLYINSLDYFSLSADYNLFTHTWSLGVEEQFYFLYPSILYLASYSRNLYFHKVKLMIWITALSVLSLIVFLNLHTTNPSAAFYLLPSRFWEIGSGALAYIIRSTIESNDGICGKLKLINKELILICLFSALFLPPPFQLPATVIVAGMSCLIVFLPDSGSRSYRILSSNPFVYIGEISYSLYLWHWSVLVVSRWTIGIHWWSIPLQVALIVLLSIITHNYIETPLKKINWTARSEYSLLYGFITASLCALFIMWFAIILKGNLYIGSHNKIDASGSTSSSRYGGVSNSSDFQRHNDVNIITKKCNMTPHHLTGHEYRQQPVINDSFINNCIAGSKPKVILLGDSFAQVFAQHIALASANIGYDFKILFGYSCPYPLNAESISLFNNKRVCEIDTKLLRAYILNNINQGDIIVLRLYYQKTQYLKDTVDYITRSRHDLIFSYDQAIDEFYHDISSKGAMMLLLGSNPSVELEPVCMDIQWFNALQQSSVCAGIKLSESPLSKFAVDLDRHLLERFHISKYPNMATIAISDLICNYETKQCPLMKDGVPLYSDDVHLTTAAIDLVYPVILAQLERFKERIRRLDNSKMN